MENQSYSSEGWKHVLLIIVPYLVVAGIFQYIALRILGLDFSSVLVLKTDKQFFVVAFFDVITTFSIVVPFTWFVVKKEFISIGFYAGYVLKDSIIGLVTGFIIMLAALFLLVQADQIEILKTDHHVMNGVWIFGTFVFVGISEELLLRGYVLNNLMVSFNKYVALMISSALFAIMHIVNPNLDVAGMIGLFFGGLLLGYSYIVTRNLWLPMALHFSWNFFQSFFGFNVSGNDFYSFFITGFERENFWNGGDFGLEGSVISIIFQSIAIAVLYYIYRKRKFENEFTIPVDVKEPV